jgi:DNA-binding NarL/FixJ family response regulator
MKRRMSIRVTIVEDDLMTRASLRTLLDNSGRIHCGSAYASAEEALRQLPGDRADVVLADINLPGMTGVEFVAELKRVLPDLPVLMLTTYCSNDLIFNSLKAGACGYLLKRTPPEELLESIEQVHAGGAPMSPEIARKVVAFFHGQRATPKNIPDDLARLSPREREILGLLSQGYLYKEIAERLSITLETVRTHLRRTYDKLHVHTRTEAVVRFLGQMPAVK